MWKMRVLESFSIPLFLQAFVIFEVDANRIYYKRKSNSVPKINFCNLYYLACYFKAIYFFLVNLISVSTLLVRKKGTGMHSQLSVLQSIIKFHSKTKSQKLFRSFSQGLCVYVSQKICELKRGTFSPYSEFSSKII